MSEFCKNCGDQTERRDFCSFRCMDEFNFRQRIKHMRGTMPPKCGCCGKPASRVLAVWRCVHCEIPVFVKDV